jgi:hypothetical protein
MPIGKDSLRPEGHLVTMEIQKRTMNWLPRASLYAETQYNNAKRKSAAQAAIAESSGATTLISGGTANTGNEVNLTLRIAAARVQKGINVKPKTA